MEKTLSEGIIIKGKIDEQSSRSIVTHWMKILDKGK